MIEIFDCEQGSPEWFECRLGIPTASCFDKVLAKPQKGKPVSLTRRRYLYDLAGEILTGEAMWTYKNEHTERGHELEDTARRIYCFSRDVEAQRVGFIRDNALRAGCSPDSLIGEGGGLEVKTKLPALAIECIMAGKFPLEHKPQCQGFLLITGREWIDLAIYSHPKIDMEVIRAYRDEPYIKDLKVAIECFNEELGLIVDRLKRRGQPFTQVLRDAVNHDKMMQQLAEPLP